MGELLRRELAAANQAAFDRAREWMLAQNELPIGWKTWEPQGFGRRGRFGTFGLYLQPWQVESILRNL